MVQGSGLRLGRGCTWRGETGGCPETMSTPTPSHLVLPLPILEADEAKLRGPGKPVRMLQSPRGCVLRLSHCEEKGNPPRSPRTSRQQPDPGWLPGAPGRAPQQAASAPGVGPLPPHPGASTSAGGTWAHRGDAASAARPLGPQWSWLRRRHEDLIACK